jgi:hypothetical protein
VDDVAVDECCCDVFVTFVKYFKYSYFLDTKISRRAFFVRAVVEIRKEINNNMLPSFSLVNIRRYEQALSESLSNSVLFNPPGQVEVTVLLGDVVTLVSIERALALEDQVTQALRRAFPRGSPTGVFA